MAHMETRRLAGRGSDVQTQARQGTMSNADQGVAKSRQCERTAHGTGLPLPPPSCPGVPGARPDCITAALRARAMTGDRAPGPPGDEPAPSPPPDPNPAPRSLPVRGRTLATVTVSLGEVTKGEGRPDGDAPRPEGVR